MTKRKKKIPQNRRAVLRDARYVNRLALLAQGLPGRNKNPAADLLDTAQKMVSGDFIKWLIKSAGERYEDMLHEQASTIALLKYAPQPKRRGRPRKPVSAPTAKRRRGRPTIWTAERYRELLDIYERGRAALSKEGVTRPTNPQCMERGVREYAARLTPALTQREIQECVKALFSPKRLSEARKAVRIIG